jgi:Flp pilus assembly protein TadG
MLLTASQSRHMRQSQRGATLVEYAFVLILFLTLLFGISGFGHALFVYHYLNNAAKEATRYAAVRGKTCSDDGSCVASNSATGTAGPATAADIQAFAKSIAPQSIDPSKLTITPTWTTDAGSPPICTTAVNSVGPYNNYQGCTVEVTVSYPYTFIFPFIKTGSITMSSTSEMVIAH